MRNPVSCCALLLAASVPLFPQAPPPPPPAVPDPISYNRQEFRGEALKAGAILWVRNLNGNIRLQGWDREQMSLQADIRDSENRKVQLNLARKGENLDLEAVFQQPSWFFSFGRSASPRCDMIINVPRRVQVHLRTRNGNVSVQGLEGFANLESKNGSIIVSDLTGEVRVDTSNGTLDARRLRARIKGGTSNGRIYLEDVEGGVALETSNGGIRARNLDGWGEGISLETSNGSIDVELGRATGEVSADTSNGSIEVKVQGAQTLSSSRHHALVRLAGRGQKIILKTSNGRINVR